MTSMHTESRMPIAGASTGMPSLEPLGNSGMGRPKGIDDGSPKVSNDPHYNSKGQLVYLPSVTFMPVKDIKGWALGHGVPEHENKTLPLIVIAENCLWAEYAIPPVRIDSSRRQFHDGNHRVNSAWECGPNTLVPVVISDKPLENSDVWLAPGTIPRHAVVEVVFVHSACQRIMVHRQPDALDRTLGELMQSIQGADMRCSWTFKIQSATSSPTSLFPEGGIGTVKIGIECVRNDILMGTRSSSRANFLLMEANLASDTWSSLMASGTLHKVSGMAGTFQGARALRSTVRELTGVMDEYDELIVHIGTE